jgi:hypothetical protein
MAGSFCALLLAPIGFDLSQSLLPDLSGCQTDVAKGYSDRPAKYRN